MMTTYELWRAYVAAQAAADHAADDCSFATDAEADAWANGNEADAPTFARARALALLANAAWTTWAAAMGAEVDAEHAQ